MKKVLFFTTRLPYPTINGRKVVLYNYCKGLKELFNYDIYIYSFLENGDSIKSDIPNFISGIRYAEQPGFLEKLFNTFLFSFTLRRIPVQVSLFFSRGTRKKFVNYVNDLKPDIIIFDMVRTAEYVKAIKDKQGSLLVLDMDDLLSRRYERQIEYGIFGIDTFGNYASKLPSLFVKMICKFNLIKKILEFENKVLKNYEYRISNYFSNIIFVSPYEAEQFNLNSKTKKAFYATIGVDYDYYSKVICKKRDNKLISFLGNMNISHNKDAVDFFIKELLPIIETQISDVKFKVIGQCSDEFKLRYKDYKNVTFTGLVDDIRLHIQESVVNVAPLRYGSGIKTKILETMAMGVPVVTNDIGAEGLMVQSGRDIFIYNDNREFAYAVVKLITENELNKYIANNAQMLIKEKYTWEKTLMAFENLSDSTCN